MRSRMASASGLTAAAGAAIAGAGAGCCANAAGGEKSATAAMATMAEIDRCVMQMRSRSAGASRRGAAPARLLMTAVYAVASGARDLRLEVVGIGARDLDVR